MRRYHKISPKTRRNFVSPQLSDLRSVGTKRNSKYEACVMGNLLGQWICYHQTVTEANVMHICMTRNGERGTQITTKKIRNLRDQITKNFDFNKLQSGRQRRRRTGGAAWRAWHRNLHRWLLAINWGYYELEPTKIFDVLQAEEDRNESIAAATDDQSRDKPQMKIGRTREGEREKGKRRLLWGQCA